MTKDEPEITVEHDVEPSEDAIDLEDIFEGEPTEEGARELLRQLGATEEEIDETMAEVWDEE